MKINIKTLCNAMQLYLQLLDWYSDFGPTLPNGLPDPAFDALVEATLEFNKTQSIWKESKGGEWMEVCFLK